MATVIRQNRQFIPAVLNTTGKNWFIYFSARDPQTGKMRRKKIYKGINHKKASAAKLCDFYNNKLAAGWNPWQDGKEAFINGAGVKIDKLCQMYNGSKVLRKSSINQYNSMNNIVTTWFTANRINNCNQITLHYCDLFIKSLYASKKSSSRIAGIISYLRSVFAYGLKNKLVYFNPWIELQKPKKYNKPANFINDNDLPELAFLIESTDKQLWLMCQFVYYCFIRPYSELRFAKIGWINFTGKCITIPEDYSKNKKTQTIPIPQPLFLKLDYLKSFPPDHYIFGKNNGPGIYNVSKNHYQQKFMDLVKDTRFKTYSVYSFKHTGAIKLVKAGCAIKDIQMQMRHHSLDETDKYLRQMLAVESDFLINKFPEI